MNLSIFFNEISHTLNLGTMQRFFSLSGGLLHQIYALETNSGRFAVKLLNPDILKRPEALENYRHAQQLEQQLEQNGVSLCAALYFHGEKLQRHKDQFYYIFPYLDAKALYPDELTKQHCAKMGVLCADIHRVDFREDGFQPQHYTFDWSNLCKRIELAFPERFSQDHELLSFLETLTLRAQKALLHLPEHSAICHGDLDCKNVLWPDSNPCLIDLECLCRSSPWLELMESALCFSGFDRGHIEFTLLEAYLQAYRTHFPWSITVDWQTVFDARTNWLGWLEYNLRRALGEEAADDTARDQGIRQAEQTRKLLCEQEAARTSIIRFFTEIFA